MSWTITEDVSGWIDPHVKEDVLNFHAKTTWALGSEGAIPRPDRVQITPVPDEVARLAIHRDHPLSPLPLPGESLPPFDRSASVRAPSAKAFCSQSELTEANISVLLGSSFGQLDGGRRPYPSAGALYPAGVIFIGFEGRVAAPRLAGAFHYRPSTHRLERIGNGNNKALHQAIFAGNPRPTRHASAALAYFAHLGISLFKYRYRGYRHALLEVGAMGQQVDLVAKEMGLATCLWSGYSDLELARAGGLNPTITPILITQLIGHLP